MKQNAATAQKVAKLRRQRNKARHALRLMTSARDNVQAQLARERTQWDRTRRDGQEDNQRKAGIIQALRGDLESAERERDHLRQVAHEATVALELAQTELDRLTKAQAIRVPVVAEVDFTDALAMDEVYADPEPSVHDASSTERLRWLARRAQRQELLELLGTAWGIIANAGPIDQDPPGSSPGWSRAALRFRESYHDLLQRLRPLTPEERQDHHTHVHVSIQAKADPPTAAQALADELERRAAERSEPHPPRFGGILPTDLLADRRGSHDPSTAAGTSEVLTQTAMNVGAGGIVTDAAGQVVGILRPFDMVEPAKTEDELEDELLDHLANASPAELRRLADEAEELAPLRPYEPMTEPTPEPGDYGTEARIAPSAREPWDRIVPEPGYRPSSPEAAAGMVPTGTTDEDAQEAGAWAALEAGERVCANRETHLGHDWWDEHEPDATKWFCPGVVGATPPPTVAEDVNLRTMASERAIEEGARQARAGTWSEGTFTVTDTDGSTATYAWDGAEPIATTPPPIELEPERYEALVTYLRDGLCADEPESDAEDILAALGLYVPEEPPSEPTELDRLAAVAPPAGPVDRLVADVLAHHQGGLNNPGPWFLEAATVLYPGLPVLRSPQRDHIWELATELARSRVKADLDATDALLARQRESLELVTKRVANFSDAREGYAAMLAQLTP